MVDLSKLREPFAPDVISWRVGTTTGNKAKGMALAYIDARDVQDRLDEVCGPENWQCRYPHANSKTVCEIGIRIGTGWVWKADGAGDSDVEKEKGALSDAFKRAAVRWGVGRYLYDVASPWVELEPAGKSWRIKESELPRLRAMLAKAAAPAMQQKPATGMTARAFFAQRKLTIALDDTWDRWAEKVNWAIQKCPDVTTLDRLRADNFFPLSSLEHVSATLAQATERSFNARREALSTRVAA